MKRQWNILNTGWHAILNTGWHGEQWDFQNNEKTMKHSDHWIMSGWHGGQWDLQKKTTTK